MTESRHHRNCFQVRGVPQSLLDEGIAADLCDCKTLWMIDGAEFERRAQHITEWGVRIPGGNVLIINTAPVTDDVRDSQVKAMAAAGNVGELVSRTRVHVPDTVSDWAEAVSDEHVPSPTEFGPDYCKACSEAAQEWVTWPCPARSARE